MIVLGIGNVLMKDDGIGVYLTEALMKEDEAGRIRYIVGETDVDFCLGEIEDAPFLIVLDAVQQGAEPGTLYEYELSKLTVMDKGIAAHNEHLFQSIQFRKGVLIGIEIFDTSYHYGLSQELEKHFPKLVEQVRERIREIARQIGDGSRASNGR